MDLKKFNEYYKILPGTNVIKQIKDFTQSEVDLFYENIQNSRYSKLAFSEEEIMRLNSRRVQLIMEQLNPPYIDLADEYKKIVNITISKEGQGDFLKGFNMLIPEHELIEIYVGDFNVEHINSLNANIICFYDSFEYIPDIFDNPEIIKDLNINNMIIAFPYCHFNSIKNGLEFDNKSIDAALGYFYTWQFRQPNKKYYHIDIHSLTSLLFQNTGYSLVNFSEIEDDTRRFGYLSPVVLTAIFCL